MMYTRNMRNTLTNIFPSKAYSCFSNKPSSLGHVLIGGGTGFIGSNLREMLLRENYKVTVISRVKTGEEHIITWADVIKNGIPNNVNAIVNLTGEPIMIPLKKFSEGYKKQIWISRVGSTMLLADIINRSKYKPDTFISVTSTDVYPKNGVYWENFTPSDSMINSDFFSGLSTDWEKSIRSISTSVRQILIRTGTVLGHDRGFIKWLNYTSRMGLGSLGDGCQYQPWIHMCDLIYLILFSIENKQINGVLNGVSPEKITNGQLTTIYTQMLKRSTKLNINETILKTIYGKERSKLLLEGKQVLPTRTLMCGFQFEYCEIEKALKHLLCHK